MNVLSTFNGMGCIWIALDRLGIKVNKRYSCEIDKYANIVNDANYPDTIQLGDITKVKHTDLVLEDIDLLVGGSPCQGFSFAGKQLNFEDPRSKLFFEFVRILKECKPKYFLLENVRMKKESQDIISKYLGVEPIEINSALVSAQSRKRLYWTNIPGIGQPENKCLYLKDIIIDGITDTDKAYCLTARYSDDGVERYYKKKQKQIVFSGASRGRYLVDGKRQDGKIRTAGLTEQRIELRKDQKTNTLTTVQKDNLLIKKIVNVNPSGRGQNGWVSDIQGKSPTLTTNKGEGSKIGTVQINPIVESNNQPYQQNRIYHTAGKNPSLLASLGGRYKVGIFEREKILYRTLLPVECERLQTVPDNYTNHVSKTQRYKMLGNGWTIDVIAHILKGIC